MTSTQPQARSKEQRPEAADPYAEPLAVAGKAAIIVPLIIGGALVAAAIMLWNAHVTKLRIAAMTKAEEQIREDLRHAYGDLRSFKPAEAVAHIRTAEERMRTIQTVWPTDYVDLKAVMLLLESEAEFSMDPDGKAAEAEEQFTRALSLMSRASGEMWQFGVFGRARTRMYLGRFREAEEDLTILMDRNPSFGAAYYWRAKAREGLGDADGAAEDEGMARRLDSWPPLRDFMLETQTWNRDILCDPEVRAASRARNGCVQAVPSEAAPTPQSE